MGAYVKGATRWSSANAVREYLTQGWPEHISDDAEREAEWQRRLNGRHYGEEGMVVKLKGEQDT